MTRQTERGQVLVIFAAALIVLIVTTGLVIDGGWAWAQERHAQNAADAASRSGAVVLGRHAADPSTQTEAQWGEEVRNSVFTSAVRNDVDIARAVFTDWQGNELPGAPAVDGRPVPAGAFGVHVVANRLMNTHLIRVVGINQWTITEQATAVAGWSNGCADTLNGCILLPVTFPVTVFQCGRGNTSVPDPDGRIWERGVELTIPLCGGNPGSVGWIDWTPTAGGASELTDVILHPTPQNIPLPSWHFITETGDISAAQVENALNTYAGQVVLVPLFDSTCNDEPVNNLTSGCPPANVGGSGVNQWYHITNFLAFRLASPKGAFVNGDNSAVCALANAAECLKGAFVDLVSEGEVGAPCPDPADCEDRPLSVQLIR